MTVSEYMAQKPQFRKDGFRFCTFVSHDLGHQPENLILVHKASLSSRTKRPGQWEYYNGINMRDAPKLTPKEIDTIANLLANESLENGVFFHIEPELNASLGMGVVLYYKIRAKEEVSWPTPSKQKATTGGFFLCVLTPLLYLAYLGPEPQYQHSHQ